MGTHLHDKFAEEALIRRQVYLWDEVDNKLAECVVQQLALLADFSKDPLFLLINSPGGDMDAQTVILDEMNACKKSGIQVYTIACGIAYSAAAAILSMGTKGCRFARPNAAIMLHPARLCLVDDYESNQRILMKFLTKRCDSINRLIAKACGMSTNYKKFLSDIDKGLWLSAKEAVKYGVVDGIWRESLPYIAEAPEDEEKSNE